MDALILSRIQFAMTVGFHFIFPSITLGLAWLIVVFMTRYLQTGDSQDRSLVRFWIGVQALTFAVGVATGITMEFQFGTNWARYSRFVGDIFGAPLAAEGIISFFLESAFIAVLVFGWGKVSDRMMWLSSLLVAVGATISAFWIIVAGSWQQTPAGYRLLHGRVMLDNFMDAVFNPSTMPRFLHTLDATLIAGAFFVMGVSAVFLLRGDSPRFARASFKTGLIVAFICSVLMLPLGHYHAVQVARTQPLKLAAIEGHFETRSRAPALLFGIPDAEAEKVHFAIEIPAGLSMLAYFDPDAEVKGLKDFPKDEWPPLALTFFPFHLMVALGTFFIGFTGLGVLMLLFGRLFDFRTPATLYFVFAMLASPLPILANELGWTTAEVGRQPWIVYGLLKTADAYSHTVPAAQVLASLVLFALVYALLFVLWFRLLRDKIRKGPGEASS